MKPPITGMDYDRAAERLGCDSAAIEAVAAVESSGSGFNPDESPKTLFEGHWFHKLTGGRFDKTHTTLSYPKWTREWYGRSWQDEQTRLEIALALDETAAMMATSWGRFQLMGFNHGACGYATVQDFVAAMRESEAKQLDAFVGFIESKGLADELRDLRWADFAMVFNGPGYKVNRYDEKMAAAYAAAKRIRDN